MKSTPERTYIQKDTPVRWKCTLCGRDKFTQKSPHNCVGGFRKRKIVWEKALTPDVSVVTHRYADLPCKGMDSVGVDEPIFIPKSENWEHIEEEIYRRANELRANINWVELFRDYPFGEPCFKVWFSK